MVSDTLILLWNCPDCTQLKMNISFEKAFEDSVTGRNGQVLHMYYTFSNSGFKAMLEKFAIIGIEKAPVLKKFDGTIVTDLNQIIEYMKANY